MDEARKIDDSTIEIDRLVPAVTNTVRHNRKDLESRLASFVAKKVSDDYIYEQQVKEITDLLNLCDDVGVVAVEVTPIEVTPIEVPVDERAR